VNGPIRTHRVVGEFDQVAAVMATARESGRLVAVHSARELPGGLVEVIADLRHPKPSGRSRSWLVCAAWLLGLMVVVGVVWLLVLAVLAVIAWVSAHLGAILAVAGTLLVLLWLTASGGSSCRGVHCGGCRR
jgi:hypothetical protein